MPATNNNQDRRIMRDVAVLSCTPLAAGPGGSAGTPMDFLGIIESVTLALKREFASTTGSADVGSSRRATRWGEGSVKLTGFSAGTGSKFAAIFAAGSHGTFQFTEVSTGDSYQLVCSNDGLDLDMGKDTNKHSLSLVQEGTPWYAPAAGTLAAMTLE